MYVLRCLLGEHPSSPHRVSKYSTAFALITSRRSYIHNGKKMKRFSFAVVIVSGGDSHIKRGGMLVVSLRGVNFGFWSHLGCSGQTAIICSREGLL